MNAFALLAALSTTPLFAAPAVGEWDTFYPGGATSCSHNTPYAYFARAGANKSSDLVVEFQGGGACFDALTCDTPSYTRKVDVGKVLKHLQDGGGILSGSDERNPVLGWNHVFIPYCTGDAHLGNHTPSYGIRHVGRINALSALEWVKANVTSPKRVFVTGLSAGSAGSYVWAPWIFAMFPEAKHYHLGDSYVAVFGKTGYDHGKKNWDLISAYYPKITDIDTSDWYPYITAKNVNATAHFFPDAIFSSYVSADDSTEKFFYDFEGCGAEGCDWRKAAQKGLAVCQSAPNFAYFRAPGTLHGTTESDAMYNISSTGVVLGDWIRDLLNDKPINMTVDCANDGSC